MRLLSEVSAVIFIVGKECTCGGFEEREEERVGED